MAAADKAISVTAPSAVAVPQFTFEALQKMAASMANSGMFGFKDEAQALSLLLISQAEGRHPALAARDYHVIKNLPSLKADTMLSRFQESGGSVEWHVLTDAKVEATFRHPQGGAARLDWTLERAKQAGLAGKDNWQRFPRAMLRSRVVTEGVRTVFPGVAVGIYTPEELQDGAAEIDVTPVSPVSQSDAVAEVAHKRAGSLTDEEIEAAVDSMNNATSLDELKAAFSAAQAHAKTAGDKAALERFAKVKDLRKEWVQKEAAE